MCAPTKELHVLDCINGSENHAIQQKLYKNVIKIARERAQKESGRIPSNVFLRAYLAESLDNYVFYFSSLLHSGRFQVTCDITPTYCSVDWHLIDDLIKKFETFNVRVLLVYMIRDPVDRFISAFNMKLGQSRIGNWIHPVLTPQIIKRLSDLDYFKCRSTYSASLDRLKNFNDDQVRIGIFENIFSNSETQRTFLESILPGHSNGSFTYEPVNPSKNLLALSQSARMMIAKKFRHEYEYCFEYFREDLPYRWYEDTPIQNFKLPNYEP